MWTKWNGDILMNMVNDACIEGCDDTVNIIGEQSDNEVPLDEGTLQDSRFINSGMHQGTPTGILSYGGGPGTNRTRVPYALKWHFIRANFQNGRKAYYLKDPLNHTGPNALLNSTANRLKRIF